MLDLYVIPPLEILFETARRPLRAELLFVARSASAQPAKELLARMTEAHTKPVAGVNQQVGLRASASATATSRLASPRARRASMSSMQGMMSVMLSTT